MTEEISSKIKAMFLSEGGLPEQQLNSRISEMLFIAVNENGDV
jgi:hypothetical protein